jgi:hypothetical protein
MATNIWSYSEKSTQRLTTAQAFSRFRQQKVDLDPDEVATARRSRDYLQDQISNIADKDKTLPRLAGGYKPFGSFARSTKVRPLDDIDMLSLLNGRGTVEVGYWYEQYTYLVQITDPSSPLAQFADSDGYVNSTRILNKFKSGLQAVPNYQKAEIKRNGVAVVLNLRSYPWAFDVVPSLPVTDSSGVTIHYLIPNGSGKWMRTDPRRDQTAITEANKYHDGNLIPLIRLLKYWNMYSYAAPRIGSYYLETMPIDGLRYHYPPIGSNLRVSVPLAFQTLATQILSSCPDPKGLGPNLDANVPWEVKRKVHQAANERAGYANQALEYEQKGDHKNAIKYWGLVFPNFPAYDS